MTGPHVDAAIFIENLNRLWPDANLRFPGEHVAWSLDGTQMLAHARSTEELTAEMDRLGIADYVGDYMNYGDSFLTGMFSIDIPESNAGVSIG